MPETFGAIVARVDVCKSVDDGSDGRKTTTMTLTVTTETDTTTDKDLHNDR